MLLKSTRKRGMLNTRRSLHCRRSTIFMEAQNRKLTALQVKYNLVKRDGRNFLMANEELEHEVEKYKVHGVTKSVADGGKTKPHCYCRKDEEEDNLVCRESGEDHWSLRRVVSSWRTRRQKL